MFEGLMSRWMMPFWCACWMAWQTGMNSSSRWRVESFCLSQYSVMGAGVQDLGDVRVVHQGQRLAFGLEAGDHGPGVHAELDDLEGDTLVEGHGLIGHIDHAHATFAQFLQELVLADHGAGAFGDVDVFGAVARFGGKGGLGAGMGLEQAFDGGAEFGVGAAGAFEVAGALRGRVEFEGAMEDVFSVGEVHRHVMGFSEAIHDISPQKGPPGDKIFE
jgi:hypothetical protein